MGAYLITLNGDYHSTPVSEEEESKIKKLISLKKLPDKFSLKGRGTVLSNDIIGFSDKPLSLPPSAPKFSGFEAFASHVRSQPWYKRAKARAKAT